MERVDDWRADEVPATTSNTSGPDYPEGECTWFAAKFVREQTGFAGFYFPRLAGEPPRHAKTWPQLAKGAGVHSGSDPQVNAVAVFTTGVFSTWGHVAVVTAVHQDGTFDIIESNYPKHHTVTRESNISPASVTTFLYPPSA